ncbi:MAG: NAD-dependent DNA ligase LigA [Candidatus Phytoplasma stylosanthis]|uniref:NAD-dependent DNA ligase LigA n=1 Tax=Candidatus Phytoplasma stylosanthis TaxID=2798314 RepID=UPI00293A8C76|nr:NAD-dependent DNA ligase LigA [Candidatus Phytoplasma stylosanthis]MDV3170813.1 NAD-dependent DNA ligase LigA [Candidatus Phytoplasma stylosanthis]MDV3174173.1 NAD-dependent DNA ligase LigA [Candidatus Phytoplasma stylosanthis]MDV3202536.1 NAD-dependent DNA ligase LigA [Candidatus Phytoplasma stylosanthis]
MTLEIKKKIKKITDQLNQANYDYYYLSKSKLSDNQYDILLKELFFLEKKYPNYKLPYSPTFKVGGFLSSKFDKLEHKIPMLSLDNVFNLEELKKFFNFFDKKNIPFDFITELKIDGVSISLKYEKGILVQALTRGNGIIGELITQNVQTIKDIPLKLTEDLNLEVRGEIFFDHYSFQKLNKEKYKKDGIVFSNPRNAASGTLRQLNSSIVSQRKLSSFIYSIVEPPSFIKTQEQVLLFLKKMGFSVNQHYKNVLSFEELKEKIIEYEKMKNELFYDVDGIVIKLNKLVYYPLVGYTTKFPKWAIAYKFNSLKSETVIQKITFQIGRTGVITPVAHLLPVFLEGSLISKVTLHNYDYIRSKDIQVNDFVLICKAGSVIPKILEVVKRKRVHHLPFQMITHCPCCHSLLNQKENEVDYFCLNKNCEEQKKNKIIHFASREVMDIKHLGKKTLIVFFQKGLVQKISDLYFLKEKYEELKKIPNLKDKKILNILDSLEKSKKQSLDKILFGLSIKHVGLQIAKVLSLKFKNIDNIKKASLEQLLEINEIGSEIAQSIYQYFQDETNLKEIDLLKQKGICFSIDESNVNKISSSILKNKKVVVTGVFKYSRKKIINLLEEHGAFVLNNVSSKIDYLIKGEKSGSKLKKALLLKIRIIDEKELNFILNSR